MFVKTEVVLDDVLVPLHHEPGASIPNHVVALVASFTQLSWIAVIITIIIMIIIVVVIIMIIITIIIMIIIVVIIMIITQPGLLSNRNPAFGES